MKITLFKIAFFIMATHQLRLMLNVQAMTKHTIGSERSVIFDRLLKSLVELVNIGQIRKWSKSELWMAKEVLKQIIDVKREMNKIKEIQSHWYLREGRAGGLERPEKNLISSEDQICQKKEKKILVKRKLSIFIFREFMFEA